MENSAIVKMTKKYMEKHLAELLSLEHNWKGEDIGEGELWDEKSFLWEAPRKWEFSLAVESSGKIIGYLIGSQKTSATHDNDVAYIHRIVVDAPYRREGMGTRLMKEFEDSSMKFGLIEVQLRAFVGNEGANEFYKKLGYTTNPEDDIVTQDGRLRHVYKKPLA